VGRQEHTKPHVSRPNGAVDEVRDNLWTAAGSLCVALCTACA
jgi:hypothetical protein